MAEKFYTPIHRYAYMAIERSRLLGLSSYKHNAAEYGAYVRNLDTGASSFASPCGEFVTHAKILKALKQMPYDPTDTFVWHAVLFPYAEQAVDFAYYIKSDPVLSFPAKINGMGSYVEQIKWIAEQEGLI